jgi:2-desacetyl-2-hydroxyethyl bacteriochlorophyllide A dehydrogenase
MLLHMLLFVSGTVAPKKNVGVTHAAERPFSSGGVYTRRGGPSISQPVDRHHFGVRAIVIQRPGQATLEDVPDPVAGVGEVVVDVDRVGVCGTDLELFRGEMPYLATGRAWYPLRPGHEWSGRVTAVGDGVDDAWTGARVTGDTMLACGTCHRCVDGRRNLCRNLVEVGISLGRDGALAERIAVPVTSLHRLPESVDDTAGALVEPGGNAWRAADAAGAAPGVRVLVWGAGTIGLLATAFAAAAGAEVHVVARNDERRALAERLGATSVGPATELPQIRFDAVIDATTDASVPAAAIEQVQPGGRVVFIGLSGGPSVVDTRQLVLREITAVGILSGSAGLRPAIERYADGSVDPRPVVSATLPLERAPEVLAGWRPSAPAPKVHFDPRL